MMQKTSIEIVLTPEEAERYHRAIHQALCLFQDLPPLTRGAFDRAEIRADLMRLAALLDDAAPPLTTLSPLTAPDPFVPEEPMPPDLTALEVFLSTLLVGLTDTLVDLGDFAQSSPRLAGAFHKRRQRLWAAWYRFAEEQHGRE